MNDLQEIFYRHNGRTIDKWSNYFEVYDRHFSRFRGKSVTVLEFGVFQGGSLQMWREYFGPNVNLIGVDMNPACKIFENDYTRIFIGDQGSSDFLREIARTVQSIDILIDDASHFVSHQILTFRELFPCVSSDGIYLCEDNHTSYWPEYGGKYRGRGSYIEFTKGLIDELHGWHGRDGDQPVVTSFTRSAQSIHFYDSILVIEKKIMAAPKRLRVGTPSLPDESFDQGRRQGLLSRFLRATAWLR